MKQGLLLHLSCHQRTFNQPKTSESGTTENRSTLLIPDDAGLNQTSSNLIWTLYHPSDSQVGLAVAVQSVWRSISCCGFCGMGWFPTSTSCPRQNFQATQVWGAGGWHRQVSLQLSLQNSITSQGRYANQHLSGTRCHWHLNSSLKHPRDQNEDGVFAWIRFSLITFPLNSIKLQFTAAPLSKIF